MTRAWNKLFLLFIQPYIVNPPITYSIYVTITLCKFVTRAWNKLFLLFIQPYIVNPPITYSIYVKNWRISNNLGQFNIVVVHYAKTVESTLRHVSIYIIMSIDRISFVSNKFLVELFFSFILFIRDPVATIKSPILLKRNMESKY